MKEYRNIDVETVERFKEIMRENYIGSISDSETVIMLYDLLDYNIHKKQKMEKR